MLEQINNDIKNAMKSKEKEKLAALRYLKSMLMENQTSKSPRPEMDVVISHHKKLKDSLGVYPSGHPAIEQITAEIAIVEAYMPQPLSEADVVKHIEEIKGKLDAPQMGAIMKELSPQIKGRFDGKLASELVKKAL